MPTIGETLSRAAHPTTPVAAVDTVAARPAVAGLAAGDVQALGVLGRLIGQGLAGAGADILTLGAVNNTSTVSHTETIVGGSGADTITLGAAASNASVDLGAGADTLTLGNFTNHVSVANIETVYGQAGADFITVSSGAAAMIDAGGGVNQVTGHAAADVFVFDQNGAGDYTTIMNFNPAAGNRMGLDITGASTLPGGAYDVSALTNGVNIEAVATAAIRHATTLPTGGHGGFLYEQDTGALYYSPNGAFAGGGTLIGVITTNGAAPWSYNFGGFQGI